MNDNFKIGDPVNYPFAKAGERYVIVATKNKPRKRSGLPDYHVPGDFDYLIYNDNQKPGEHSTFIPVHSQDIGPKV